MARISLRLPEDTQAKLEAIALAAGRTESELVREALEVFLKGQAAPQTCFDLAKKAGVIGCVKGGPADVSTNPKYLEGFGE